ncbi:MAG: T9SS type A sorting domain-containing protein, partial [Leadbetterella sp.]|nr:T9SS type A sorting domain-containing protein [Leadbetterella sp.]
REREEETLQLVKQSGRKREEKTEEMGADSLLAAGGLRVRVWPNVFSSHLQVEIRGEEESGEVQLVDFLGNILRRESYRGKDKVLELQTEKLDTGVYVLRVSSGGQERTLRVIKSEK